MTRYYVYILESQKDGKLYIGVTNNLNRRLLRHNNGKVLSTKYRRPLALIHSETIKNLEEARRKESYLKKLKSSKYIRDYIVGPDSSIG